MLDEYVREAKTKLLLDIGRFGLLLILVGLTLFFSVSLYQKVYSFRRDRSWMCKCEPVREFVVVFLFY